jgi:hypothetical protein
LTKRSRAFITDSSKFGDASSLGLSAVLLKRKAQQISAKTGSSPVKPPTSIPSHLLTTYSQTSDGKLQLEKQHSYLRPEKSLPHFNFKLTFGGNSPQEPQTEHQNIQTAITQRRSLLAKRSRVTAGLGSVDDLKNSVVMAENKVDYKMSYKRFKSDPASLVSKEEP